MKINIKATGMELTAAISDYVQKKISHIEKYLHKDDIDVVVQVEVGKISHHHKAGHVFRAEVHVTGNGLDLYAVSDQEDLYAAIDIVKDEVVRELVQMKERRQALTRRGAGMMKSMMKGFRFFKRRP